MLFKTEQIAQREGRDGFTGLTYAKKPQATVPPSEHLMRQPTFPGDKILKTMPAEAANRFSEEVVERQRFLDAKTNLNGKRDVSSYEDRTVLRFDPVEQYEKERCGHATYDSGRHQSGTRGDQAFMSPGTELPEGRGKFTTLERQNPYQLKLPGAIKIRQ